MIAVVRTLPHEFELPADREQSNFSYHHFQIPNRTSVVEPVHADPLPRESLCEPLAGVIGEDLLLDPALPVLADVARLRREDDRWLTLEREQDVRVTVDDEEAGEVADGALEAGVLAAGGDDRVELVLGHRLPDQLVPPLGLYHDSSSPLTSAVIISFSGVGTPCSRPKRATPPFR